jgi:hypothetical protein
MSFTGKVLVAFMVPVAICAPIAAVQLGSGGSPTSSASSAPSERATRSTLGERLIEVHDCWTGDAPTYMAGQIPGHVVVTTRKGRTIYSASLVGPALDQVFGGSTRGLTVRAFCP